MAGPLWVIADVIIHSLTAEVHFLVAPVRGDQLRLQPNVCNVLRWAVWHFLGQYLVEDAIGCDCFQLVKDGSIGARWEAEVCFRLEQQTEWEVWLIDNIAFLIVHCKIRVADCAYPISGWF